MWGRLRSDLDWLDYNPDMLDAGVLNFRTYPSCVLDPANGWFIGQATIFVLYSKASNVLIIQSYVFGKLFSSIDDQFISMHVINIHVTCNNFSMIVKMLLSLKNSILLSM